MNESNQNFEEHLRLACEGDQSCLTSLFRPHESKLKRMVQLRLNRVIQGRIDPSDVVQEAFLEASKRLREFQQTSDMPFYLWLRHIAGQKLIDAHRRHLGAEKRDAGLEISLLRRGIPIASSASFALQLLGGLTSPSEAAIRAETQLSVQEALNGLSESDREILALRHFEQLSNTEVAILLRIDKSTASTRYLRALKRVKAALSGVL